MSSDLAIPEPAPVTLFRTDQPDEIVERATATANALAEVIRQKRVAVRIQGREYVRVEGWTLLGTMLGVFPICMWTRGVEDGWEARVEARTLAGAVVGAAEAQCTRTEKTWANRDDYALRSMAQTRATSKALRLPLGFVMTLAGFEATPAEEMPSDDASPGAVDRRAAVGDRPVRSDGPDSPDRATQPQVKKLHVMYEKLVKANRLGPDFLDQMQATYETTKFSELSKADASKLIDAFERLEAEDIPF